MIWKDKPPRPMNPVVIYDEKYAGDSAKQKLAKVGANDENKNVDILII